MSPTRVRRESNVTERCSMLAAGEPLAGTAPYARSWLILEQAGPWGRRALLDSPLAVGPELQERTAGTGVTVVLARSPRTPESSSGPRRFWIAHCTPGGARVRTGVLDAERRLLDIDFAALGRGEMPSLGERDDGPWLFVCTHSRRDACCAVLGRAFIDALRTAAALPGDRLWECSHLGGHRFAPTVLALPSGAVYGRVDPREASALAQATADRRVLIHRLRGLSALPAPLQAAMAEVRERTGIDEAGDLDALQVVGDRAVPPNAAIEDDAVLAEVRHVDGRAWRVAVRRERLADDRPESCGVEPTPAWTWRAAGLAAAPDWRPRP